MSRSAFGKIGVLGAVAIFLVAAFYVAYYAQKSVAPVGIENLGESVVHGVVAGIDARAGIISVADEEGVKHDVSVAAGTQIFDDTGKQSEIETLGEGDLVMAQGDSISGNTFAALRVQKLGDVRVYSPVPGDVLRAGDAVTVRGRARGSWFFEANIALFILDESGSILDRGFAMTSDEWMTTDFVSFEGTLTVTHVPPSGHGFVRIANDNPSDRRDLDTYFDVPVRFSTQPRR